MILGKKHHHPRRHPHSRNDLAAERHVASTRRPKEKNTPQVCGKDANGNRLAFDLGKSDIKTVAIKDGEVLESAETELDVTNPALGIPCGCGQ